MRNIKRDIKKQYKPKAKKKKKIPVYNTTGRVITPGKVKQRKIQVSAFVIIAAVCAFIYLPQIFIKDNKKPDFVASPSASAIKLNNSAIRSGTEEDFDGDGMSNADEEKYGTNLFDPDTDGDGAYDVYEINTSKTDPNKYDKDILIDIQTKEDNEKGRDLGSPYKISNVILWADDYDSKAHGSVIQTMKGYRICNFNGYAKFPEDEGRYAYKIENGVRELLPYLPSEGAYRVEAGQTIELYQEQLEDTIEIGIFNKKIYIENGTVSGIIAKIIPDRGFFTMQKKMKVDVRPDTSRSTESEIVKPEYDSENTERFTANTVALNDLLGVRKVIADGGCTGVSLYNEKYGEYLAIAYGYTASGNLLMADMNTLKPIGELIITEKAKKIADRTGSMFSFYYFDFEGFGFNSKNGDRINFFCATIDIDEDTFGQDAPETDQGTESATSETEATNAEEADDSANKKTSAEAEESSKDAAQDVKADNNGTEEVDAVALESAEMVTEYEIGDMSVSDPDTEATSMDVLE